MTFDRKSYQKEYNRKYHAEHRDEHLAAMKEYYEAHKPEFNASMREYNKEYRKKNPERWRLYKQKRRTLEQHGDLTFDEWIEVLDKHDGKCVKCGSDAKIEMDHIIPLSKGGQHTKSNVQPLCRKCNRSKHNKVNQHDTT